MSAPHLSNGPKTPLFTNAFRKPTPSYPPPESSYEEIIQNPHFFLEKLQRFHAALGTKFKVPKLGGKALDLHRLFIEVTSRGGIEKVIRDRSWREVVVVFNFGPTITNASFVLRKFYLSLLYHFEQVYYFHKKVPALAAPDAASKLPNGSVSTQDHSSVRPMVAPGVQVTGTIDKKCEKGYMVTVDLGSEKLKGILYHLPPTPNISFGNNDMYQLALRESSPPETDRSGYGVFFSEHYAMLKPLYHGQENLIRKRIQVLWNTLTEEEKQVYEEKGWRGKER